MSIRVAFLPSIVHLMLLHKKFHSIGVVRFRVETAEKKLRKIAKRFLSRVAG